jgi:transcription antitermination factor NusA-like protein
MVRTILDNFCVKSGTLCQKCEEKVRKGQITQQDLKIIRTLSELERDFNSLQNVFFHKSVDTGNTLAILVDKSDIGKILGHGGKIIRTLGEKTGKRIKILAYGTDPRQFLEELLNPFSILTINTVWLPDGTTETKVILHGREPRHMPVDLDVTRRLAKDIAGLTLRIEFERQQ